MRYCHVARVKRLFTAIYCVLIFMSRLCLLFYFFFILFSSIVLFAPYNTYNRHCITLIVIECEVKYIANYQCVVLHCTTLYDYG